MLTLRPNAERGRGNHGWLISAFSFSFADYYDPEHMGFRALRVINEDYIKGGSGFPTHPHRDMEIVTYVLSGALEHKDSTGTGSVIRHGDVQRMTAGTGIRHSEFNHSQTEDVHLLQIWLLPEKAALPPSYEEKHFDLASRHNKLCLIAARDGRDGALNIHQDVAIYCAELAAGRQLQHSLAPGRHAYLQLASGELSLNGTAMDEGDGAMLSSESKLEFDAQSACEFLLFDLA